MQPVLGQMYAQGWEPVEKGQLTLTQGLERAGAPLKAFLIRFAREKDVRCWSRSPTRRRRGGPPTWISGS